MTRDGIYEIICTVLTHGDIAQLVERLNGIEKVRGSTPLISTIIEMRFAHMKQGLNAFFVLTDSSFIPWKILEALAKPL